MANNIDILLDTNALLAVIGSGSSNKLSAHTMKRLSLANNVYFSPISLVEIHIKTMLGKLRAPKQLRSALLSSGLAELPYTSEAAEELRNLRKMDKHDPFDRMLIAQSIIEKTLFLTSDAYLISLGLDFIVDSKA